MVLLVTRAVVAFSPGIAMIQEYRGVFKRHGVFSIPDVLA